MKITIISVGKIKEKFYRDAIDEYAKRLSKYCKFEVIEVADEKTPDKCSETEEQLRGMLTEEALVLFEDYVNKCTEFSCISCADSYITGFRHGSRFTYDAFIDE